MNDRRHRDVNEDLDGAPSVLDRTGYRPNDDTVHEGHMHQNGGHSHRGLMLVCCIPMVLIVLGLLATGAAGTGAIVFAAVCIGLMALMMFAMPGDHKH